MGKSIGNFISSLRKANGYTQESLAEVLGVSNKTISSWENDKSSPDLSMIPVLAELFHVSCDEILKGERILTKEENEGIPDKAKNQLLKRLVMKYRNMNYISIGLFIAFLVLLIPGCLLLPRTVGLVLIILAICVYVGGIVFSVISYNNIMSRVTPDTANEAFYRLMLKYSTWIKCLYSFFLLSFWFCLEANTKLKTEDKYGFSETEIKKLSFNTRLKKILSLVYLGCALVLFSVFAVISFTPIMYHTYSLEEVKERIYKVELLKKNNELSFGIQHVGTSIKLKEEYQNIEFPNTVVLDIYLGKENEFENIADQTTGYFTIKYYEDSCGIFLGSDIILKLSKNKTKNNTIYFSYNQEKLIEDFNQKYYYTDTRDPNRAKNNFKLLTVSYVVLLVPIEMIYFMKKKKTI